MVASSAPDVSHHGLESAACIVNWPDLSRHAGLTILPIHERMN
jgi:hypothetical protein